MEDRPPLRPYVSDSALQKQPIKRVIGHSVSEPTISTRKHPLLDETDETTPHSYQELLFAAEPLENIVNEGSFAGTVRSKFKWHGKNQVGRELSDRVLKLVYGTMKYLPYIDSILVKTQFLVFNNQFLDSLGLVKVVLYNLMKYHFDYKCYPGISFDLPVDCTQEDLAYQRECVELVRDLDETFREFQIKMSAAYARLRIERQASGESFGEQMENILPPEVKQKEEIAIDIPKTLRINSLKCSRKDVVTKLEKMGYGVVLATYLDMTEDQQDQAENLIYLDDDFDDLLVIPAKHFNNIKNSALVEEGFLVFQDKASVYCSEQLKTFVKKGDRIIDARAGCGTKLPQLSTMVGKNGHIYAFENRPARLETLRSHLKLFNCTNVTVIEDDFGTCNPLFENVSTIIVEPMNSGTNIVDKLGFMLQEEEYPVDNMTMKDLLVLKRQQVTLLKHAFKFPNVKNILYQTRSIHAEENENVVLEVLERWGVEWKLNCVLPDIPQESEKLGDIEECLTIEPSNTRGNGIFLAHFHLKPTELEPPEPELHRVHNAESEQVQDLAVQEIEKQVEHIMKPKRKRRERKRGEPLKIRLPKQLKSSVERLSVPRIPNLDKPKPKAMIADTLAPTVQTKQETKTSFKDPASTTPFEKKQNNINDLDVAVYGISLSKFYGPRSHAIQEMYIKKVVAKPLRWIYPVPNPTKWK